MYVIRVKDHFDAAHWLADYVGKCNNLHGHRWEAEVMLLSNGINSKTNMVIDFKVVKNALKLLLDDLLDHRCLNDALKCDNPTAEFIARWIFVRLNGTFPECMLQSVTVWESPECSVTYSEGN